MRNIAQIIMDLAEHELYEEAVSVCEKSFNEDNVHKSMESLAQKLRSDCIDLAAKKMDSGPNYSRLTNLRSKVLRLIEQVS